ncbi:Uncharacterized protein Fot_23815 [Forsythia ovata]|uniref:Uncharacterized protein n=1 Tax=Forsythia ovata TaxID=205694 RepID=A0ABD1U4H8_9LAMI
MGGSTNGREQSSGGSTNGSEQISGLNRDLSHEGQRAAAEIAISCLRFTPPEMGRDEGDGGRKNRDLGLEWGMEREDSHMQMGRPYLGLPGWVLNFVAGVDAPLTWRMPRQPGAENFLPPDGAYHWKQGDGMNLESRIEVWERLMKFIRALNLLPSEDQSQPKSTGIKTKANGRDIARKAPSLSAQAGRPSVCPKANFGKQIWDLWGLF